jgi:sec-independent protein translocase protein TatB
VFSFSGGKILLIIVIALLLFGPDKIPQMARMIGRFMREFNKYKDLMDSTVRAEIYKADWKVKAEEDAKKRGEPIYGEDLKPAAAEGADAEGEAGEGVEGATPDVVVEPAAAAGTVAAPEKKVKKKKPVAAVADVIATDEDEEDEV